MRRRFAGQLALLLGVVSPLLKAHAEAPGDSATKPERFRVYVGTYTGPSKSRGIYSFELNTKTGEVSQPTLAGEGTSPSFLAIHPSLPVLYAVNEVAEFNGEKTGSISSYAIDPKDGSLKLLNQQSSKGAGPCHLTVDHTGKNVLTANYGSGSVAVLPIAKDGSLSPASSFVQHQGSGPDASRQEGPHAHSINVDAGNHFAVAADLGLDKVIVYRFDADQGTLKANTAAKVAPGAGPRHFAFHPNGRLAFVINEMHSTLTSFTYDAKSGVLTEVQTVTTLPEGKFPGNSTAEVQVHPSGKFVYGSNRGHNSIAAFAVDAETGKLTPLGNQPTLGKTPRNFAIDPTGSFLLAENQDSDTIFVFRIDPETGKLTPTGQKVEVPMPVCVKFLPLGAR